MPTNALATASREILLHALYEAAELEHNLMCTYLYAAFSLKSGGDEGISLEEGQAVARWRREILGVAVDEMSHLVAVWNITSALGGVPRFGRTNFPLDPGYLPAGIVVKLAPFSHATLQRFIHLERSAESSEPDGEGYAPERQFVRGSPGPRLTPMGIEYATVGEFYASLAEGLRSFAARTSESTLFAGDPSLQLGEAEAGLRGATRVICLKTALAALETIVLQGEGAERNAAGSHFERFCAIRSEYAALEAANPIFDPSHPAATNPVLRRPPRPEGRVWIESPDAVATVDLANATYGLALRLLGYSYAVASPDPDKALAVDLAVGLMRAVSPLGERAARLGAGPTNPHCNAGMSFTTLRDAAPLPPGRAARRFFIERLEELAAAAGNVGESADGRIATAHRLLVELATTAARRFGSSNIRAAARAEPASPSPTADAADAAAARTGLAAASATDAIETVEGRALTFMFEARRCIHARFCVTGAPTVFLANVKGPWLHPDAIDPERLAEIAHSCPSGAIRYRRTDGRPGEDVPPVNLAAIREAGPYALRGELRIEGLGAGFRATLCRCGASKNKPFCDGSHHEIGFSASGEPPSGTTDMLPNRDGPLLVDPQTDGPLQIRGNLEITTGTGRVVARVTSSRLCRCGGSSNKPFCDGTHARIGFRT
jgi:CDGSH-type Zn-finger protein/uncharacterized Fe-S cluster protein YjdI